MKVLVVDDDATSRLIAHSAATRLGHECETAADGAEAWTSFQSKRPDVVITDWMMPGLTGLELCAKMRADTSGPYTYLILVTSRQAHEQLVEGMSSGADDYLVKPLNPDELQVRLIAASRVTSLHRQLDAQRTVLQELNLELEGLARRDPLTGLGNRRLLEEDLEHLEARVKRYGHRYCMALLDIDHFKGYNDSHGHQAGDQVLATIGGVLREQSREGDQVYRYGGEEFLCILPEQTLTSGFGAVERTRIAVHRLALAHEFNETGVVTVSAGLAMLDPERPRPAGQVLKEADDALYRAKSLGRNRVEGGRPPMAVTGR